MPKDNSSQNFDVPFALLYREDNREYTSYKFKPGDLINLIVLNTGDWKSTNVKMLDSHNQIRFIGSSTGKSHEYATRIQKTNYLGIWKFIIECPSIVNQDETIFFEVPFDLVEALEDKKLGISSSKIEEIDESTSKMDNTNYLSEEIDIASSREEQKFLTLEEQIKEDDNKIKNEKEEIDIQNLNYTNFQYKDLSMEENPNRRQNILMQKGNSNLTSIYSHKIQKIFSLKNKSEIELNENMIHKQHQDIDLLSNINQTMKNKLRNSGYKTIGDLAYEKPEIIAKLLKIQFYMTIEWVNSAQVYIFGETVELKEAVLSDKEYQNLNLTNQNNLDKINEINLDMEDRLAENGFEDLKSIAFSNPQIISKVLGISIERAIKIITQAQMLIFGEIKFKYSDLENSNVD